MWPHFDWSISLGNVLTIALAVVGWLWIRVKGVRRWFKTLEDRHIENSLRFDNIESWQRSMDEKLSGHSSEEIGKLEHVDDCVDKLKGIVIELQAKIEMLAEWVFGKKKTAPSGRAAPATGLLKPTGRYRPRMKQKKKRR